MTTRPDDQAEDLEVLDSLVQASFMVIARLSQVAAAHDLSLTQLRVLAILRDRQPKMAELAAHLGLEKSTVSGLIDRAVRRGLVRRDADPDDARAVAVSFTGEGRRLAGLITAEIAAALAPMTGRLSPSDQKRLGTLLRRSLV